MARFIGMLEREDGFLSLARILALLVFLAWFVITLGTFFFNTTYAHYADLTYFNGFCIISVICSKWVDFKNPTLINPVVKKGDSI